MKRRVTLILLVLAMLITFIPTAAYAGSWSKDGEGFWYYYDNNGAVVKGWIYDGGYYYGDPKTGKIWTGWKTIGGYWYYFEETDHDGRMYDGGISNINGKWYYFAKKGAGTDKWGKMQYGWIRDKDYNGDIVWYYADPNKDGQMATGWRKMNGKWYYFEPDEESSWFGQMYWGGPCYIKGYFYYFGGENDGSLKTGWIKTKDSYGNSVWYYADPNKDSRLAMGWRKVDGKWYYFEPKADSEWFQCQMYWGGPCNIKGSYYCFGDEDNGSLKTGWVKITAKNGKTNWFYADPNNDSRLATGWKKLSGAWYFFDEQGYMARDCWAKDTTGWMWMDTNGKITRSRWIKVEGEWYYCKANGYMAKSEWVKDSNNWCYMDSSGKMARSRWIQYKSNWYYVNSSGYMVTGEQLIDGTWWNFGDDGKLDAKG